MLHYVRLGLRGSILGTAGILSAVLYACGSDETSAFSSNVGADAGESTIDTPDSSADEAKAERSPLVTARPYGVTVPSKYDPKLPTPLILLLHGYTATAKVQDGYFLMSALAERKNFLLALPDGTVNPLGKKFWNATDACCDGYESKVDDLAYLKAVIADMKATYNVDPKRTYIVGHSNGGFMAHRLACDVASEIAGIVSVAGAMFGDPSKCSPTEPVAVLQVHGDQDATIKYGGGGPLYPGASTYPSAKATVATWAKKNGCSAELTDSGTKLDLDTKIAGPETIVERHACTKGAAELWTIAGGGHIPSFDETWGDRLYDFLKGHPKP